MIKSPLPELLQQILKTGQVWDDQGRLIALDSNVSADEALLLHAAVMELKPALSAEVGLAKGVSTLAILGALQSIGAGHHVVMDPFQSGYGNAGIESVRRAGLDAFWTFHRNFAEEVIPSLGKIQFAFIDASHLFDLTLMEFVLVDKKLEVGGVVAFHDLWMPALQNVIRFILLNRQYEIWHPPGFEPQVSERKFGWKDLVRKLTQAMPGSERIFSTEFLRPWQYFRLGNLVMLRKKAEDARDWRFFQRF